jgi:ankyrin repeat protein
MGPAEATSSKSSLLGLPNELLCEVASLLKDLKDLNSLVCTSQFFHGMFNTDLYRRAVAADAIVLDDIVGWVLSNYRLASLTLLLDNGLSINHTGWFPGDMNEETMLYALCRLSDQERSIPLARLLIQRGADMQLNAMLFRAILYDNSEFGALLLAHGADLNVPFKWGQTPLCIASRRNKARMANLLIASGSPIEGRGKNGDTPLLAATKGQASDVFPMLLAHGANIGACNENGATALHYASQWWNIEHHELAKSLLAHGAVVNARDRRSQTPLHYATRNTGPGGVFMAKFLLDNGADVNAMCLLRQSPLKHAIRTIRTSLSMARLLLSRGADLCVLNEHEKQVLLQSVADHGETE